MKFCSTLVGWTSAALTCLTVAMFHKHFSHFKRRNHSTGVKGASDNDLGLYGVYTLPISYKGKIIEGKFVVCSNLDVDLLAIDIIGNLLRHPNPSCFQHCRCSRHQRSLDPGFLYQRHYGQKHCGNHPFATRMATIASPRHRHLAGCLALVFLDNH